jgi:hypothetical protein
MPVDSLPRARSWAKVNGCIVDALGEQPGRIVLLGSHGGDEEFREVVEEALWRELEVDVGMLLRRNDGGHSEWAAARGAAELGWRGR